MGFSLAQAYASNRVVPQPTPIAPTNVGMKFAWPWRRSLACAANGQGPDGHQFTVTADLLVHFAKLKPAALNAIARTPVDKYKLQQRVCVTLCGDKFKWQRYCQEMRWDHLTVDPTCLEIRLSSTPAGVSLFPLDVEDGSFHVVLGELELDVEAGILEHMWLDLDNLFAAAHFELRYPCLFSGPGEADAPLQWDPQGFTATTTALPPGVRLFFLELIPVLLYGCFPVNLQRHPRRGGLQIGSAGRWSTGGTATHMAAPVMSLGGGVVVEDLSA